MRFEPRLVRPDEPEDDLELPADLADLADQLSADAQYLAARYPAETQSPAAAEPEWGRRLVRSAAVAVLLFGVGLWSARLWRKGAAEDGPALRPGTTQASGQLRELADDAVPGSSALQLRGLSGGQQEGVLDLLEEQPHGEARASI